MTDVDRHDSRPMLARALDQAGMVIAHVTLDQAGHPTPCDSWDVKAVATHLISGLDRFRATAQGETVDWSAGRPRSRASGRVSSTIAPTP